MDEISIRRRRGELHKQIKEERLEHEKRIEPFVKELNEIASGEDILVQLYRLLDTIGPNSPFAQPPKWVVDTYKPAIEKAINEIESLRIAKHESTGGKIAIG